MSQQTSKRIAASAILAGMGALAGCAGVGRPSAPPLYRCGQGIEFTVTFTDGTAVLKGARTNAVLLRDAGGQGAETVFSGPQMRAEFGLGASGCEATLHYFRPPLEVRCLRD